MTSAASFPELQRYLSRLHEGGAAQTRLWADAGGCAYGRYFNSTLTSAFQPVRELRDGTIAGFEGFARSNAVSGQGLCIWKLLDHAASDEESVELDRLCRMLHAMNFFRQPLAAGHDLYLSVHARLLAAVDACHGAAFSRILEQLRLPRRRVVLQLPPVEPRQNWALDYVADNYRRSGFRLALNAHDPEQALALIERVYCEAVKIDAYNGVREDALLPLLEASARLGVRVIFKRVQSEAVRAELAGIAARLRQPVYAQGYLWDLPTAALASGETPRAAHLPPSPPEPCVGAA